LLTIEFKRVLNRFKTREKTQTFVASEIVLGEPHYAHPDMMLYKEGLRATRCWARSSQPPGPLVKRSRPTHPQHRRNLCILLPVDLSPRLLPFFDTQTAEEIKIITYMESCVRLFADSSIKPRCNKNILQGVRGVL